MFSLCSCSDGGASHITMAAIQTVGQDTQLQYELPTEVTDRSSWKPEKNIQKIASFEDNISLFGIYENDKTSVLVEWDEFHSLFDWSYLTPQGLSLVPYCFDVDHDGTAELIVDIGIGTGTGIAISELHIVKPDTENSGLIDYVLPESLYEKVAELLSMKISKDSILLSAANQQIVIPYDDTAQVDGLCQLGNIVSYEMSEDSVAVSLGIGLSCEQNLIKYVAMLTAEVRFSDGFYTIGNFTLESW